MATILEMVESLARNRRTLEKRREALKHIASEARAPGADLKTIADYHLAAANVTRIIGTLHTTINRLQHVIQQPTTSKEDEENILTALGGSPPLVQLIEEYETEISIIDPEIKALRETHLQQRWYTTTQPLPTAPTSPPSVINQGGHINREGLNAMKPFNGHDASAYPDFLAKFNAHIGKVDGVNNESKFYTLQDKLTGEARSLIDVITPSPDAFDTAIQMLDARYINTEKAAGSLVKKICAVEVPSDKTQWSGHYTTMRTYIKQLLDFGYENACQALLRHIILERTTIEVHQLLHQQGKLELDVEDMLSAAVKIADSYKIVRVTNKGKAGSQYQQHNVNVNNTMIHHQRTSNEDRRCIFCYRNHDSAQCRTVVRHEDREQICKERRLCTRCTRAHPYKQCEAPTCSTCNARHINAMCPAANNKRSDGNVVPRVGFRDRVANGLSNPKPPPHSSTLCMTPNVPPTPASVHTEEIKQFFTLGKVNVSRTARSATTQALAFLDNASSANFVTTPTAKRLKLRLTRRQETHLNVIGGNRTSLQTRTATMYLHVPGKGEIKLEFNVVPEIIKPQAYLEDHPRDAEALSHWHLPDYVGTRSPDVFLGIDGLKHLNLHYTTRETPDGLNILTSNIGCLLTGVNNRYGKAPGLPASALASIVDINTSTEVQRYCKVATSLENLGLESKDFDEPSIAQIEEEFKRNIQRNDGRYKIKFPLKANISELPSHFNLALSWLKKLASKLKEDPELLRTYEETFRYQLNQDMLEIVDPDAPLPADTPAVHYSPYHHVWKDSSTTKLRIVLNPTAKSSKGGLSLNECMHIGAPHLPVIWGIMLRSRTFKNLILSDIEKAFQQVELHESHRPLCRFLFPRNLNKPISPNNVIVYQYKRVMFGYKPSPYALQETINHLCTEKAGDFGKEIIRNLYVDNVALAAQDAQDATTKSVEARQLFESAHMNLREFISNLPLELPKDALADKAKAKILGIKWDVDEDQLVFRLPQEQHKRHTKATVLGTIATVFDPLGLLQPVTMAAKIFHQTLWKLDLGWHVPLPEQQQHDWDKIMCTWTSKIISFQRHIVLNEDTTLHVFTDASEHAFGAVLYLRTKLPNDQVVTQLYTSKGRVTPLRDDGKKHTIPQKELFGVLLGVIYTTKVLNELDIKPPVNFWVDNTAVLHWIQDPPKDQPLAVRNAIKKIRDSQFKTFRHVPTEKNPADILSRGCTPNELQQNKLWNHGPTFLRQPPEHWPKTFEVHVVDNDDDKPPLLTVHVAIEAPELNKLERVIVSQPSFRSMIKLVAVLYKWMLKSPTYRTRITTVHGDNVDEFDMARNYLFRTAQQRHPPTDNQSQNLRLQTDQTGLLRSIGRIKHAQLPYNTINPVFLPNNDFLTEAIIRYHHELCMHLGANATLTSIRREFWIPSGRRTVQQYIRKCSICSYLREHRFARPIDAPLPPSRTSRKAPFSCVGVDMFSTFPADNGIDYHGLIFACLNTRAVHLELVPSQSASDVYMAFQRFESVRGTPDYVISDNGPNLVAARTYIEGKIKPVKPFSWHLIARYSPWRGGAYERLIGIVKTALKRAKGRRRKIDPETWLTLFKRAEAAVNNRPLIQLSDDLDALHVLRPVDFLRPMGPAYLATHSDDQDDGNDPEYLPTNATSNEKTRRNLQEIHGRAQALMDKFWDIWSAEYLTSLREVHRLQKQHKVVRRLPQIGEAVILDLPFKERDQWPIGLVIKHCPSSDNLVRTVDVRIRNYRIHDATHVNAYRVLQTPINNLILLEIDGPPHLSGSQREPNEPSGNGMPSALPQFKVRIHTPLRNKRQFSLRDPGFG